MDTEPPLPHSACLSITLMGAFRAEFVRLSTPDIPVTPVTLITDDAWGRPAGKRLLIYFALHMGTALPRDRILDDLWPDNAPDAAHGLFKTIFSLLRQTLEPDLSPKATSRFFAADQQTYTFNPRHDPALARTDVSMFEMIVSKALSSDRAHDAEAPPQALLDALSTWQPFALEFARQPWAIEAGERVLDLYVQACIHTANAFADLARPIDAAHWAERATRTMPWSEEAWLLAIRARAHTGDRAAALAACDTAMAALQHELGAPPSPLLLWLAERLRAGQDI